MAFAVGVDEGVAVWLAVAAGGGVCVGALIAAAVGVGENTLVGAPLGLAVAARAGAGVALGVLVAAASSGAWYTASSAGGTGGCGVGVPVGVCSVDMGTAFRVGVAFGGATTPTAGGGAGTVRYVPPRNSTNLKSRCPSTASAPLTPSW